ncbi:MAG: NADP-dependent isocitrate dehydrogenase, partial [Bacteroidota bacterium]
LQLAEAVEGGTVKMPEYKRPAQPQKDLVGIDIFVDWPGLNPDMLADRLQNMETTNTRLSMITNRGIKVWPNGFEETFCTDHWRCRFERVVERPLNKQEIIKLLYNAEALNIDTIKTENLYSFDGEKAFSLGQGQ